MPHCGAIEYHLSDAAASLSLRGTAVRQDCGKRAPSFMKNLSMPFSGSNLLDYYIFFWWCYYLAVATSACKTLYRIKKGSACMFTSDLKALYGLGRLESATWHKQN